MQRHVFVPLGQSKRRKVRKTNIFVDFVIFDSFRDLKNIAYFRNKFGFSLTYS